MNNIFDPNFISSLKSEIQKQLAASKEPVTRNTVLAALNLGLSAEGLKDAELAVSLAFRLGLVPEYKMFQKIGIKAADYTPSSKKTKEPKEPKRKLNPKVKAKAEPTAEAEAEPAAEDEVQVEVEVEVESEVSKE